MNLVDELNGASEADFASVVAPLFEHAPRFIDRLTVARPFADGDEVFDAARAIARSMPEDEQIELLNAHPAIGATRGPLSDHSRREQGLDVEPAGQDGWVADELAALNAAYEELFGFRFVVFVAGRPRADIIPMIERAVRAARDEELRRGLDDVVLIAEDRWQTLRGPEPLREELREAIALEVSRWMVGELDPDGLSRASHRLIEEGVTSPALVALSLVGNGDPSTIETSVGRLMAEIGLEGWDGGQAGQLLALHAAASILGDVSQPIDGARRIATVSTNPEFGALVVRWESTPDARQDVDAEIQRAAAVLFDPHEEDPGP
ncbi:MAG: 2-oxo-4-hydroxy-4-carboxy-5-ureidoimidazoline decarboxylase [Candidatus Limnocylindria bacterium]